ncbi:unnamed protein product [Lactuca saligna]|uniref:Uncharacterized protein n=1 Tax=Lactuca saligna TaxID=75948 RepID=A0AA36E3P8_LACSI|nr:unnamed protein product [Lactuca saligna]
MRTQKDDTTVQVPSWEHTRHAMAYLDWSSAGVQENKLSSTSIYVWNFHHFFSTCSTALLSHLLISLCSRQRSVDEIIRSTKMGFPFFTNTPLKLQLKPMLLITQSLGLLGKASFLWILTSTKLKEHSSCAFYTCFRGTLPYFK